MLALSCFVDMSATYRKSHQEFISIIVRRRA